MRTLTPRSLLAALLGVGAVVMGVLYAVNPVGSAWLPKCLWRSATGLSCPGCGFQRSVHALLHGRVAEAVGYNLFLPLVLPYFVALLVAELMPAGPRREKWRLATHSPWLIWTYVAMFFCWWIVRNLLNI